MAAGARAAELPPILVRVECRLHVLNELRTVPFDALRRLFRRTELVFTTVHVDEEYLSFVKDAVLTLGVRQEPTKRQTAPSFVTLAAGFPDCKAVTAASGIARLGNEQVPTVLLWQASQAAPRDGLISRETAGAFFWEADINVNESKTGCISFRVPPMGQSVTLELMPRLCDGMGSCGLPRPVFAIDLYWGQLCVYTTRANVYHSAWKRGTIIANGSPDALELYYDSASRMWRQQIVPTPRVVITQNKRRRSRSGMASSHPAVRTVRNMRPSSKDKWPTRYTGRNAVTTIPSAEASQYETTASQGPTLHYRSPDLPPMPGMRVVGRQPIDRSPVLGLTLPDVLSSHARSTEPLSGMPGLPSTFSSSRGASLASDTRFRLPSAVATLPPAPSSSGPFPFSFPSSVSSSQPTPMAGSRMSASGPLPHTSRIWAGRLPRIPQGNSSSAPADGSGSLRSTM